MRMRNFMVALALAVGVTGNAQALLYDRGGGLIYDTVLDVTWLQDANYFKTQVDNSGDGGVSLVNGIISEVGTIVSGNGTHTLTTSDFHTTDGRMTWYGAMAWTQALDYVDPVSGVTLEGWRLPTVEPVDGTTFDYSYSFDGSTDLGYNISAPGTVYSGATGSELAYMYYNSLGNLGYYDTAGSGPQAGWSSTPNASFTDGETGATVSFQNLESSVYWSGTEYGPNPTFAWGFSTGGGFQDGVGKVFSNYAWAVRPGDVADDRPVVPLPLGLPLLLAGLAGYGFLGRRRR